MKKGTVAFAVLAVSMLIIAMPVYAKEKEVVELPSTQIDLEETIELPNGLVLCQDLVQVKMRFSSS